MNNCFFSISKLPSSVLKSLKMFLFLYCRNSNDHYILLLDIKLEEKIPTSSCSYWKIIPLYHNFSKRGKTSLFLP